VMINQDQAFAFTHKDWDFAVASNHTGNGWFLILKQEKSFFFPPTHFKPPTPMQWNWEIVVTEQQIKLKNEYLPVVLLLKNGKDTLCIEKGMETQTRMAAEFLPVLRHPVMFPFEDEVRQSLWSDTTNNVEFVGGWKFVQLEEVFGVTHGKPSWADWICEWISRSSFFKD